MPMSTPPLNHIGIILDGNRRWAKQNGKTVIQGHLAGYNNLKKIAQSCHDKGIEYFSCYVFSTENWARSEDEVSKLMQLTLKVLLKDAKELHKKNICLRIIGSRKNLDKKILKTISEAEELTKNNTGGTLLACFNYGGQEEIVNAVENIVTQKVKPTDITSELIKKNLYTHDCPAPDLIIRTSGEQRLSNFLLWDSAYSELEFSPKYWPDFTEEDLDKALENYKKRTRRFGK